MNNKERLKFEQEELKKPSSNFKSELENIGCKADPGCIDSKI